jgi:hypothetical protein
VIIIAPPAFFNEGRVRNSLSPYVTVSPVLTKTFNYKIHIDVMHNISVISVCGKAKEKGRFVIDEGTDK